MTGEIVSLKSGNGYSAKKLLAIVDDLRASIESGEVTAIAAVGICADGDVKMWTGATRVVSPLTLLGAITKLQRHYGDTQA